MLVPASVIRRPRPRIAVLAAAVVAAAALLGSVTAPTANAMSPAQTNVSGVVNVLYWDLDSFWRRALSNNANYRSPTIGYYDGSPTYVAACGVSLFDYNIMAECPNNGQPQIWIHVGVNQAKVTQLGDYAAGFFLAHEWGHHIGNVLGLSFRSVRGREL